MEYNSSNNRNSLNNSNSRGFNNGYDRFANVRSNSNSNTNTNSNEKTQSLYGFPEKDDYMSISLREQIANLENKFYYDNCRFEPKN